MTGQPAPAEPASDENAELAAAASQWLFDKICDAWPEIHTETGEYRPAYAEDLPDGDPAKDDPYALVLQRKSDGALFDLGISASVSPHRAPALPDGGAGAEAAGPQVPTGQTG